MKAIETKYKGYRFRSRLEARWAVFFDTLGMKWEYESEGYELENGQRYLPDFYLPGPQEYVEIKPNTEVGWPGTPVYLAGPIMDRDHDWRRLLRHVYSCGPHTEKGHMGDIHGMPLDCDPLADEIVDGCCGSIDSCGEVWAWIPDGERYGTICEIGYAKAKGKKIKLAIARSALKQHATAAIVGEFGSEHGCFKAHEMWFVQQCADESRIVESVKDAVEWWQPHLTEIEAKTALFSKSKPIVLVRGVPGEIANACTVFNWGQAKYRTGLNWFRRGGLEEAVTAARSARFEFGEQG